MEARAGAERLALIEASFARLAGRALVDAGQSMWSAPRAVLAHGLESPPCFFYANALALRLFRMSPVQFLGLPSHLSAEPGERAERAALFARLEAADIVEGYGGIRIAADGQRFRMTDAVIWNLVDAAGQRRGQAATFASWEML